jgi:hypothetical protein
MGSKMAVKRVFNFHSFAMGRLSREPLYEEIIDTCLQAMQEGVLDVCAQSVSGQYVWMCYGMTADQWHRACGLLQRAGVPTNILWDSKWFICHGFMSGIEYLWTDLEAVHRYLECWARKPERVVQELDRRFTWNAGLRRAWLAACMI